MDQERFIVRADDLGELVAEYAGSSWERVREAVLEVMEEDHFGEDLHITRPEDLVAYGYRQGVGHVIMALVAGEARFELKRPAKANRRRKKTAREE